MIVKRNFAPGKVWGYIRLWPLVGSPTIVGRHRECQQGAGEVGNYVQRKPIAPAPIRPKKKRAV